MRYKYLKNVTTLCLSAEKCICCGRCTEVCPHGVFGIHDKKARIKDKDWCMGCGACAINCPVKAIDVDVGVGCAAAVIIGWLTRSEPSCDFQASENAAKK
ncbi:ferredoxin-2 [Ruminiclostridium hungatei]|uniref:Ferredoxin-2 n=1 Tax=Ruminiclostridium hungatei TaxID=48256 RepID=A0A1V4SKC4_RUMHU|nr:mercury methylation ferredoxin HgcB [Ruminiclostridium hungatei]OPX43905.1 ferredoxin-2 [Ruminiclostridium hungatei]